MTNESRRDTIAYAVIIASVFLIYVAFLLAAAGPDMSWNLWWSGYR